jgi:RNA polymerase sigma factor (sigma-70 family)
MIAAMEADPDCPHWAYMRSFVGGLAERISAKRFAYRFDDDDLTQEVMLLLRKKGKLRSFRGSTKPDIPPRASFKKWLRSIIAYKHKDLAEAAQTEIDRRVWNPQETDSDPPELLAFPARLADHRSTPEEQAVLNEQVDAVIEAMTKLSAQDPQTAHELHVLLEALFSSEDYRTLADRLAQSPDSVRQEVFRARQRLRRLFGYVAGSTQGRSGLSTLGDVAPDPPPKQEKGKAPKRQKSRERELAEPLNASKDSEDYIVEMDSQLASPLIMGPGEVAGSETGIALDEEQKGRGPQ